MMMLASEIAIPLVDAAALTCLSFHLEECRALLHALQQLVSL